MAAHLRPLHWRCDHYGCNRPAKEELRNTYNAIIGQYCPQHAKQALKDFIAKSPGQGKRYT